MRWICTGLLYASPQEQLREQRGQNRKIWALQALINRIWPIFFCAAGLVLITHISVEVFDPRPHLKRNVRLEMGFKSRYSTQRALAIGDAKTRSFDVYTLVCYMPRTDFGLLYPLLTAQVTCCLLVTCYLLDRRQKGRWPALVLVPLTALPFARTDTGC
jgi:hypothetical protein